SAPGDGHTPLNTWCWRTQSRSEKSSRYSCRIRKLEDMTRRDTSKELVEAARKLSAQVDDLNFGPPVVCVYRPLKYAWGPHQEYLRRFGRGPKRVVFLGMNPGPFGMAQTGIPFGEVRAVRDWLGITAHVEQPACHHPKRPIRGFDCARSEIS